MTPLQDALFSYMQERPVPDWCGEDLLELREAEERRERLLEALRALGGEADRLARQLRLEGDAAACLRARGAFLAGLSAGLELGRLQGAAGG